MASITDPFTGEESFNATPAKVYSILSNMECYAKAIPGLVSHEMLPTESGHRPMKVAIKPGLSFVSGTVKATLRFASLNEPADPGNFAPPFGSVILQIDSSGIGMTLNLQADMNIVPEGDGRSKVQWSGRVTTYSGLVKLAPAALVRGAADKVVKDGWNELRKQIEA